CGLDETAGSFPDELLSPRDPLTRHKLHRRHTSALLEHAREMKRAQFHESCHFFHSYLFGQMLAHIIFHFAELTNRQPAVKDRFLGRGTGVFLGEVNCEKLGESPDSSRFTGSARDEQLGANEA